MAFPPAGLPPGLETVCRLARAGSEDRSCLESSTPAALERAVEVAHAHNVLGVILPALKGARTLPASLQERLTASETLLAAQALFRQSELQAVLQVLDAADVEAAVLKGAFLASCVYVDFAARPMNDFDLFVRKGDLERAAAALDQAGYRCKEGGPGQVPPGGSLEFRSLGGQAIEARYDLTQGTRLRGVVRFREGEMWERRWIIETFSGGEILSLDPTDHLLYLVYHAGILHLFAALIWLVDLDRLVRRFPGEIAWEDLPARARRIGCATCLWHGLTLSKDLLGTPVDDRVLRLLQPGAFRAGLIRWFLAPRKVLLGMTPPAQPRMQGLQMLLLDSAGADIRSLWQGIFPPRQWLEWRYRTSSPLGLGILRALYPFGGWARPRT